MSRDRAINMAKTIAKSGGGAIGGAPNKESA